MSAPQQPPAYVARFGFDRKTVRNLLFALIFVILALAPSAMPVAGRVVVLLFFGVGGACLGFVALNRAVALRADKQGITLGSPHKLGHNSELHVPWNLIADIVLFGQQVKTSTVPYVGLRLQPGAQPVPTVYNLESVTWRATRRLIPHVPEDVVARSRPISGWRLDEGALAQILAVYAPHVRIVRLP